MTDLFLFPQLFHRQLETGSVGASGDGIHQGILPDFLQFGTVHDGKDRHDSRDQYGSSRQQPVITLQNLHRLKPPLPDRPGACRAVGSIVSVRIWIRFYFISYFNKIQFFSAH